MEGAAILSVFIVGSLFVRSVRDEQRERQQHEATHTVSCCGRVYRNKQLYEWHQYAAHPPTVFVASYPFPWLVDDTPSTGGARLLQRRLPDAQVRSDHHLQRNYDVHP